MASSTNVVAAGLIVYRRVATEIQFLMLQASYAENHWTPPKGHLDPGETELEAAIRETKEEAGLSIDELNIIDNFKAVLNYEVRGRPKTVIYWLSEMKDPTTSVTLSHEHQDYKWLNFKDALEYAKYADMQKALNEANDHISKNIR